MRLTLGYLGMWSKSRPNDYTSFRTFIFGITKQSMFPHGVVYEGVSDEPLEFRGESGANDSMVRHFLPLGAKLDSDLDGDRYRYVTTSSRSPCQTHLSQTSCKISALIGRETIGSSWSGLKRELKILG